MQPFSPPSPHHCIPSPFSGSLGLTKFDNASNKADDAQGAINERARTLRAGETASKVTSKARRLINELKVALSGLENDLREAGNKSLITDAEYSRRQNQLSTLKGRFDDLNSKFGAGSSQGGGTQHYNSQRSQSRPYSFSTLHLSLSLSLSLDTFPPLPPPHSSFVCVFFFKIAMLTVRCANAFFNVSSFTFFLFF